MTLTYLLVASSDPLPEVDWIHTLGKEIRLFLFNFLIRLMLGCTGGHVEKRKFAAGHHLRLLYGPDLSSTGSSL
jgi:hypothetical protein